MFSAVYSSYMHTANDTWIKCLMSVSLGMASLINLSMYVNILPRLLVHGHMCSNVCTQWKVWEWKYSILIEVVEPWTLYDKILWKHHHDTYSTDHRQHHTGMQGVICKTSYGVGDKIFFSTTESCLDSQSPLMGEKFGNYPQLVICQLKVCRLSDKLIFQFK